MTIVRNKQCNYNSRSAARGKIRLVEKSGKSLCEFRDLIDVEETKYEYLVPSFLSIIPNSMFKRFKITKTIQ